MAFDLIDKTGNGNTLTNDGAFQVADTPFPESTVAADFELGETDKMTAADSASLSMAGDMTIELWVNFESLVDTQFVSKFLDTSNVRAYRFGFNETTTDELTFAYSTDGTFEAGNAVAVAWDAPDTATWFHVAVTFDASAADVIFYVNGAIQGVKQDGTGTSVNDGSSALFIVALDFGAGENQHFDGLMTEIRIWNDVRTAAELLNNKDRHLTGSEANLVAYWPLEGLGLRGSRTFIM